MTYTNKFQNLKIADDKRALTVEEVYKKYAAFAGVQGFEFTDEKNTWDSARWSPVSGITIGNTLSQVSTDATERVTWYDADMPHSYTFEFTASTTWAVYVRGDGTDSYYRIGFTGTLVSIQKIVAGVVVTSSEKSLRANQIVGLGRFKIAVRDAQFTSDSAGRTLHIALWMNDYILHTFVEDLTSNPPLRLGFAFTDDCPNGLVYSNFRVPNLGEIILVSSLDPGEFPIGAIQRAIEDRYLMAWVRWNGKLRAWSPTSREVTSTISTDREFSLAPQYNIQQGFSHIRILGAFQWVQMVDQDLMKRLGYRFQNIDNTAMWNIDDCRRIGLQMFIRAKEQVFQANFSTAGYPYLEKEDRVRIPDHLIDGAYIDYILDTINWQWSPDTFEVSATFRKYYYGEP